MLADLAALPGSLGRIFYFIVLPMLLLVLLGYVVQRRLGLDMPTLTRLNFYLVVPALIYFSVVNSKVPLGDVAKVIVFSLAMIALLAVVTDVVARLRGVPRDQRRVMLMTTMFYNSGNYGLPLQEMAFRSAGLGSLAASLQVFTILCQNFTTFTLGVVLVSSGRGQGPPTATDGGRGPRHWRRNLMQIVRFPPIYALAAALLTVQARRLLGPSAPAVEQALAPFWDAIGFVKDAFVAVALATLGAQLAMTARPTRGYPIVLSVLLRLVGGPAVGLGLVCLLHHFWGVHGFLAQMLLISTAPPTAVNSLLLCLEFKNHPDFAARAVFYSTLLSPLTVTLTIYLAQSGALQVFQ